MLKILLVLILLICTSSVVVAEDNFTVAFDSPETYIFSLVSYDNYIYADSDDNGTSENIYITTINAFKNAFIETYSLILTYLPFILTIVLLLSGLLLFSMVFSIFKKIRG